MTKTNRYEKFITGWSCTKGMLRFTKKVAPKAFPITLLCSIVEAVHPLSNVFFASLILNTLSDYLSDAVFSDTRDIVFAVGLTLAANLILSMLRYALTRTRLYQFRLIQMRFNEAIALKSATMEYAYAEDPETQKLRQLFQEGHNSVGGIQTHLMIFGQIMQYSTSISLAMSVFSKLFFLESKTQLSGLTAFIDSPSALALLFVLLFLSMIFGASINRLTSKKMYEINEVNVPLNRKAGYMLSNLFSDYRFGKDVRLYNMQPMLLEDLSSFTVTAVKSLTKVFNDALYYRGFNNLLASLLTGAIYFFVGAKALNGTIGIGDIILYVGAITNFNASFTEILSKFTSLNIHNKYAAAYLKYLSFPDAKINEGLPLPLVKDNGYEIEFVNVSFCYPGSEQMMLQNISLKMNPKERLAVVGLNGAGKTTFIKLLCRLYDPTEGQILLNGIDIKDIDYQTYLNLFSVVFQDFKLFPLPLDQNIAGGLNVNEERFWLCLKDIECEDIVNDLPKGMHNFLYKSIAEDGIELSGGDAQKVGIARALYKNAPFVILDEPTAALDPLSEFEIYSNFNTLVGSKSAIYISHRLSSCRFCDDIAVFHQGKIIQKGSHDELIVDKNGHYAAMWQAQAQYYVDSEI